MTNLNPHATLVKPRSNSFLAPHSTPYGVQLLTTPGSINIALLRSEDFARALPCRTLLLSRLRRWKSHTQTKLFGVRQYRRCLIVAHCFFNFTTLRQPDRNSLVISH